MSEFSVEKVNTKCIIGKYTTPTFLYNKDESIIIIDVNDNNKKNICVYDNSKNEIVCRFSNISVLTYTTDSKIVCTENNNKDFYIIDASNSKCNRYNFSNVFCGILTSKMSDGTRSDISVIVSYIGETQKLVFSDFEGKRFPLSLHINTSNTYISDNIRDNIRSDYFGFYENRYILCFQKIYDLYTDGSTPLHQMSNSWESSKKSNFVNGMMIIIDGEMVYKFGKREPKKGKECIVCFSEMNKDNKKVLATPCGHALFCKCVISNRLTTCPVCRVQVQSFIPVFDD